MKSILVTLFLFISFLGFGQSVSAPDSKSFIPSTNGQDGSGFVLSGFGATETLLASISLINPPTNTTFYLNRLDGLTPASGFTLNGNKTRLVVTGTMANINLALANLKINTGSIVGNVQLSVAATVNPVGYYYNGVNGHFYKPVTATNERTTYTNARARSLLTTFKGQTGYLVTITSASEDQFIQANVPVTNIWFAATDEVVEGRWVIDAGPEKGTVIKTSNPNSGNVAGQYNNWAGGEPNGYNGSENYAVTKWNGNQWNDLSNNWSNPYVIEYGTWSNPDDATFTEFYTNSVTHSNGDVLRATFNIDFGSNVDETKFSANTYTYQNNIWNLNNGTSKTLNGLGKVDMTSNLDTVKVLGNGYKALTTAGQVEWAIIDVYSTNFGGHRLYIDGREFDGTGVSPSDVTSIQLFDIYNGPITYVQDAGGWKIFRIVPNISTKITSSTFQQYLRLQNGWYGTSAEFTFTQSEVYKPHGIELNMNNQSDLTTLYSSIVGVSDVYLAFKELSNGGILGNQSGLEFSSGIQFMNADVDGNGIFNESDTYKLLQHLTGVQPLNQYSALPYLMKLYNKSEYDTITKSNWNTQFNYPRNLIPFTLSGLNNTYNLSVTWLGDVNLSHSAQQSVSSVSSNSIRSMSVMSNSVSNEVNALFMGEIVGNKVIITLSVDPLQQELVGTQFQLNYDNTALEFEKVEFTTKGNPTNFGTDKGTYVKIGSLITNGSTILDKTTEYKITFIPKIGIQSILGLTSISATDAVNKAGTTLKIKMK
jgi:hypothetical protein